MIGSIDLTALLRTINSNLQTPVVFLLLFLMAVTVLMLGSLAGETITERLYIRKKTPGIPDVIREIRGGEVSVEECIRSKTLIKRHKDTLLEVIKHPELSDTERESYAVRLLSIQSSFYNRRVKITDLIAKIGPMLGLMGTLIPLGPGIIALGQGDTFTLSNSLMVAFDTTVAGLICAAVAMLISVVRKSWYKNDMSLLEALMECVLEEVRKDD